MNAPFPTPKPTTTTLVPTHIVVLRDGKTGETTWLETQGGVEFKALAGDLAHGQHLAPWGELAAVILVEPASGRLVDVTKRILHEVSAICEAQNWEHSPRLSSAFEANDVPPPVVIDFTDPHEQHRLTRFDVLGGVR